MAYELRISYWMSDVCSADLFNRLFVRNRRKKTPHAKAPTSGPPKPPAAGTPLPMRPRERRRRAEQPRLRVGDQLDRDRRHEILEPSLRHEAFGKARADQMLADAQPQPAGDHHPARPLRQRQVARDAAQ